MSVSGYRFFYEINRGSITTAWLGERLSDKRLTLVKQFNSQWANQSDLLERFRREATISLPLKHPNIVEVLDVVEEGGGLAIVLDYIDGVNLACLLGNESEFSFEEIAYVCFSLLSGLDYAHQNDIIHRDIKPDNVMVSRNGVVMLTDFGLAKTSAMPAISVQGEVVGTPAYMSPEQARAGALNQCSDLFSLGTTIYEMASGDSPFSGDNIVESIEKLVSSKPPLLHTLRQDIPRWFSEVVGEMMQKQPDERPDSASVILSHPEWKHSSLAQEKLAGKVVPLIPVVKLPTGDPQKTFIPSFGISHFFAVIMFVLLIAAWKATSHAGDSNNVPTGVASVAGDSLFVKSELEVPLEVVQADQQLVSDIAGPKKINPESVLGKQPELDNMVIAAKPDPITSAALDTMDAILQPSGVFVVCRPWGDIYVNGKKAETTPLFSPISLLAGSYLIEVRNPQYQTFEKQIKLTSGRIDTMEIVLQAAKGFLDIQVVPWAQIYVNGEYKETSPLQKPLALTVGKHSVRLLNPAYPSWEGTIEIFANETTQKKVTLTRD
ncbi:MAG: protein kinase domain-containing protein [Calditrichia bacterium]